MKTVRFLFSLMIAAVLLTGTSLAQQRDHPSQQAVSHSSEKSADQQKNEVRNDTDQARTKSTTDETQEQPAVLTRRTTKRRLSASHSKLVPTYQARPVKKPTANSPRIAEPGSVPRLDPMDSKPDSKISNNVVSRRSPSVPSSAVSVNGQQFRNSRDPGAHLAASGGAATIARGTAAINGTGMKRKP
jgi:hypothetical protein